MRMKEGFTLIETIISLSLAAVLLAVVWSMFDVYTKIEQKGVAVADQANVLRAIRRQIRSDLMALARIDSQIGSPMNSNRPTLPLYPSNGYLKGNADELHFLSSLGEGNDQLRAVTYSSYTINSDEEESLQKDGLADKEELSAVQRINRSWIDFQRVQRTTGSDFSRFNAGRRIELDQDDFLMIGVDGNDQTQPDAIQFAQEVRDEIPELSRLKFRYFDRGSWSDQWDSGWTRRLPEAIEVEMTLPSEQESLDQGEGFNLKGQQESAVRHRFVVSLGVNTGLSTRRPQ